MINCTTDTAGLLLPGLDGANPLAFLAALGTLRTLTLVADSDSTPEWLQNGLKMSWTNQRGTGWHPILHSVRKPTEDEFVRVLNARLESLNKSLRFPTSDDNLKLTPDQFRVELNNACQSVNAEQLAWMSALACDLPPDRKGFIQKSFFQMVNGGKRQNYLEIIRTLGSTCDALHLKKTLFTAWQYDDPAKKLNLRWDPLDDRLYAYRWDDPSDSKTRTSGSMIGANRLAVEALPLMSTAPSDRWVNTIGHLTRNDGSDWWYWPIWTVPLSTDVCKSLLSRSDLINEHIDERPCAAIGVATVFGCERRVVDQYQTASFTPSQPVS